jgi:hypothetical protein
MAGVVDIGWRIIAIGVGATAMMDVWVRLLKKLGVPTQGFAMLGRWIGHWLQGQWFHDGIAKASPVKGEALFGWSAHYAIGIAFAAILVAVNGTNWLTRPSFFPALMVGIVTVAAPLFIMQPALGSGIASSKTARPLANTLKSIVNHAVFGCGLYIAAAAIAALS